MVLPIALSCWDPKLEPCCTGLFEYADGLRKAIIEPLNLCVTSFFCAEPLRSFVTIGRPSSPVGDYLVTWVDSIFPASSLTPEGRRFFPGQNRVELGVKLMESGWPVAEQDGEEIFEASDDELHQAAQHSYGRLQIMQKEAVRWMKSMPCSTAGFVRTIAVPPSGGHVGWEMVVFIEGQL